MPILTLTFKDNTIGTYRLEKGQSLTIGRKESNDIPIENLAVSGYHAKVDSVGDGYLLTDLQSKNGSFVNKELVQSHWLKEGDSILVGKHTLIFGYDEGEEKPAADAGEMDQTMIMDTDKYRDMLAQAVPKADAAQAKKKLTKIGKSPSSDIVVKGFMVGKTAATISKRPQGYSLSYVEGKAPKVNGAAVKEMVNLKEFDVIEIGSVKMQFVTEK